MGKITFLGAGNIIFAKNILGDCMLTEALRDFEIALYDIDEKKLNESFNMLSNINNICNDSRANIIKYKCIKEALKGSKYIINAIQTVEYNSCIKTDFEIKKKYGIRQNIGYTLGIEEIFRAYRNIPVILDFAKRIEELCPDAWLFNYTNSISMTTLAMLKGTKVKTVGLCQPVETCIYDLLSKLDMDTSNISYKIAGTNHMGWILEINRNGVNLYPEIKERAKILDKHDDMIRFELMEQFGYYITELSEHNIEYLPHFIKLNYPELIEKYNMQLDEYTKKCVSQIEDFNKLKEDLVNNKEHTYKRSKEYASYIMEAIETGKPYTFVGNVLNNGLITNLPKDCCIEITCLADKNGITPYYNGELPIQLANINRANINVQLLTVEAALTMNKDYIYYAAMLDPHISSELSIDEVKNLVDDLINDYGDWVEKCE